MILSFFRLVEGWEPQLRLDAIQTAGATAPGAAVKDSLHFMVWRSGRSASPTSCSPGSTPWTSGPGSRSLMPSTVLPRPVPGWAVRLLTASRAPDLHNLKELRPGSAGRSEIRVLFVFDPWRSAILLTGGDKSGN
ncbi:type II toxin-antitoxin system RelE/ParE family toxin, partial [Actinomadura latina]